MKKAIIIFFLTLVFLGLPGVARAAGYCFCWIDVNTLKAEQAGDMLNYYKLESTSCVSVSNADACKNTLPAFKTSDGKQYSDCHFFDSADVGAQGDCNVAKTNWEALRDARIKSAMEFEGSVKGVTGSVIPKCVMEDFLSPECRDVGIFVLMGINLANYLFSFIGALALIMFIYGGFVLILSQGNQEKVKQGTGIMVAAVIGLVVAFGGYLLIQFLSTSFGVN